MKLPTVPQAVSRVSPITRAILACAVALCFAAAAPALLPSAGQAFAQSHGGGSHGGGGGHASGGSSGGGHGGSHGGGSGMATASGGSHSSGGHGFFGWFHGGRSSATKGSSGSAMPVGGAAIGASESARSTRGYTSQAFVASPVSGMAQRRVMTQQMTAEPAANHAFAANNYLWEDPPQQARPVATPIPQAPPQRPIMPPMQTQRPITPVQTPSPIIPVTPMRFPGPIVVPPGRPMGPVMRPLGQPIVGQPPPQPMHFPIVARPVGPVVRPMARPVGPLIRPIAPMIRPGFPLPTFVRPPRRPVVGPFGGMNPSVHPPVQVRPCISTFNRCGFGFGDGDFDFDDGFTFGFGSPFFFDPFFFSSFGFGPACFAGDFLQPCVFGPFGPLGFGWNFGNGYFYNPDAAQPPPPPENPTETNPGITLPNYSENYLYMPPPDEAEQSSENAAPQKPTVKLVLKDGITFDVYSYWLEDGRLNYITTYNIQRSIPVDELDLQKTVDLNYKVGVTFTLSPKPPDQEP